MTTQEVIEESTMVELPSGAMVEVAMYHNVVKAVLADGWPASSVAKGTGLTTDVVEEIVVFECAAIAHVRLVVDEIEVKNRFIIRQGDNVFFGYNKSGLSIFYPSRTKPLVMSAEGVSSLLAGKLKGANELIIEDTITTAVYSAAEFLQSKFLKLI